MKFSKSQQGFTLIELLIVIAIIAILAIAVLAAINPFEQINRSRDTSSASDSTEALSAIERYYVGHNEFPWVTADPATYDNDTAVIFGNEPSASADDTIANALPNLLTSEEIKAVYADRLDNATNIAITKAAGEGSPVYACYTPASQQFKDQAIQNCINNAALLPAFACAAAPYSAGDTWTDEMICIN